MIIRPPSVAGTFYPAEEQALVADIRSHLDAAGPVVAREAAGFVVPHAGYIYSGPTAAYAYKLLVNRPYEKVAILAPSHFEGFDGLSVYSGDALATPLGEVKVSVEDRDRLIGYDGIFASEMGYRQEHSLEVQLPFLQYVLKPGWEVIPLVMGRQTRGTVDLASKILGDFLHRTHLSIISSDLSHYYPYERARRMDGRFCSLVQEGRLDALWDAHRDGEVEACGFGPIFSFLQSLAGRDEVVTEILDYRNSGDTAGPKEQVVGYCSIGVFWRD